MKIGLGKEAFTIMEVMIVLAVTSLILLGGLMLVNGQQQRTEFRTAMDEIRQNIDEILENVSTGYYYASVGGVQCNSGALGRPFAVAGSDSQGKNTNCIFLGRSLQFQVDGDARLYNIYNIVGRRTAAGTTDDVLSIADAQPVAMAPSTVSPGWPADGVENKELNNLLTVEHMRFNGTNETRALAFLTDFASTDISGNLTSSSRTAGLYNVNGVNTGMSAVNAADLMVHPNFTRVNEVTICFRSAGTDQFGIVTIGGSNRQLSTELSIAFTTETTPEVVQACL